jgi:hypothetical protein
VKLGGATNEARAALDVTPLVKPATAHVAVKK